MSTPLTFRDYHYASLTAGDVDPSINALCYVADRFELSREQRCWLAFLYGCTYTATTVYYIYNEFPDLETAGIERMKRWWKEKKAACIFQTDRARIRSNDQFVPAFESYRRLACGGQYRFFREGLKPGRRDYNYQLTRAKAEQIAYFGRFTVFNYLDALARLTGLEIEPLRLDLREAESCRDGVCYAIEQPGWLSDYGRPTAAQMSRLQASFDKFRLIYPGSTYQLETTLCAYKKYRKGQRYVGYYIDRQHDELIKMQAALPEGVHWGVLWDWRRETFQPPYLKEYQKPCSPSN